MLSLENKLVEGDCFHVFPTLDSSSYDTVLLDPPFFGDEVQQVHRYVTAWRNLDQWSIWWSYLASWIDRIAKRDSALFVFEKSKMIHRLIPKFEGWGWTFHQVLHSVPLPGTRQTRNQGKSNWTDVITVAALFVRGKVQFDGRSVRNDESAIGNCYYQPRKNNVKKHRRARVDDLCGAKLESFWSDLILSVTPTDGRHKVLDPFAGTNVTGDVCTSHGIPWTSIELRPTTRTKQAWLDYTVEYPPRVVSKLSKEILEASELDTSCERRTPTTLEMIEHVEKLIVEGYKQRRIATTLCMSPVAISHLKAMGAVLREMPDTFVDTVKRRLDKESGEPLYVSFSHLRELAHWHRRYKQVTRTAGRERQPTKAIWRKVMQRLLNGPSTPKFEDWSLFLRDVRPVVRKK